MKLQLSPAWYARAIENSENEESLSVTAGRSTLTFIPEKQEARLFATAFESAEEFSCKEQKTLKEFARPSGGV